MALNAFIPYSMRFFDKDISYDSNGRFNKKLDAISQFETAMYPHRFPNDDIRLFNGIITFKVELRSKRFNICNIWLPHGRLENDSFAFASWTITWAEALINKLDNLIIAREASKWSSPKNICVVDGVECLALNPIVAGYEEFYQNIPILDEGQLWDGLTDDGVAISPN